MIAILLTTANDSSGNPRRLWLVTNWAGDAVAVHDAVHTSTRELEKKYPNFRQGPTIGITSAEYNRRQKQVKRKAAKAV